MGLIRRLLDSRLAWLLLVLGLLWVAVGRVREGLARDPRFLAVPSALDLPAPAWGGDEVVAPVREALERLGPVNLFDPRFERRIRGALARVPGVAGVREVRRLWPDRYSVALRIYRPAAVAVHGGRTIPITRKGVVLPAEPYARASAGLLRIVGVPEPPPRPGATWTSEALSDGLAALGQIAPSLDRVHPLLLETIDVSGAGDPRRGVVLRGADGVVVRFGRPRAEVGENPVKAKLNQLAIAAQHVDAVRGYEIDVRFDTLYLRELPVE